MDVEYSLTVLASVLAGFTVAASLASWQRRRALSAATAARREMLARWQWNASAPAETRARRGLPHLVARVGAAVLRASGVGIFARRFASARPHDSTRQMLVWAGLGERIDVEDFTVGRWVLAGSLALLYLAALSQGQLFDLGPAVVLGALGYYAPLSMVRRAMNARKLAIQFALSSAVDVLAVAVGGGAVLDVAIELYCQRFSGPLADELEIARRGMLLGQSRRSVLEAMADRCDVEALSGVISAIVQGERFGTPIGQTLRTLSRELKTQRRQLIQEQLARAPVKMLLPIGTLVLPALLIVLLGPALLQMFSGG